MLKKTLIFILITTQTTLAIDNKLLSEAKQVLSTQESMQLTHEVWQKNRKKAEITDYSALLKNKAGNTLTAGPGQDCGFPNILTAINFAAPGDTIMVAEGTYSGSEAKLTINKSLSLFGGLDSNCQVFTINRTHLVLNDTGPVIEIDVSGGKVVNLSGLDISGSQNSNILPNTSGILVTGDGTVSIRNSHIHDNNSLQGGGVSAINNSVINISENTEIYANSAIAQGGGIYCSESQLNIIDTKIGRFHNVEDHGNIVSGESGQGGGLYSSGCNSFLGQSNIGNGIVEINYNNSHLGAGIYTENSNIDFSQKGSRISFNETSIGLAGNGNALLAANVNNIIFNDIEISDNLAGNEIQISGSSDLMMKSTCDSPPCSIITRNQGSPIALLNEATATFLQTSITNNDAFTIFSINGTGNSGLNVINSLITENHTSGSDDAIISENNGTLINFENVTIANNTGYKSILSGFGNMGGTTNIEGSILWGNDAINLTSIGFSGLINVINSIIQYNPDGMVNTVLEDPQFVSADNGNFHIRFNSPARDHFESNLVVDIEGNSRPQGLLDDAGAYEWTDLIFKQGFEQE